MGERELSLENLDELIEFYQGIEEHHGWQEAVRILAVFGPDPAVVRQVEHRAYDRAREARACGHLGEAGCLTGAGDALAVLAERASGRRCCTGNECECADEEETEPHSDAEVFAPDPWQVTDGLDTPSYGS